MTRPRLLIERGLDAAHARAQAPATPDAREPDAVLVDTLVSAVRTLHATVTRLEKRVAYLEGVTPV